MADESILKEDKRIVENLDFNKLKEVAKELNSAVDVYNESVEDDDSKVEKVRIVGAKKLVMFQVWRDAVETLADAQFEGTPEASVNFYNSIYDEEKGMVATWDEEEAEEVEEAEEEVEEAEEAEEEVEEAEEAEEEEAEKPKPKKKAKKKKADTEKGSSTSTKIEGFADLEERLQNPQSPTGHFDRICLEGGTVDELLAKFLKFLKDSGIEFKSIKTKHAVKKHIEYRQERGWVYEESNGKVKLVGYEKP